MEKKIYSYILKVVTEQIVLVPPDYKILSAALQDGGGSILLYVLAPAHHKYGMPTVEAKIEIIRTGNIFYDMNRIFIDTVDNWHIFHNTNP